MRIGTRASALALAQAGWVASLIDGSELVEITTDGDRGERLSDKSRWVSTLEHALLDGRIDLAVHSAKDVPGELAPGTSIVVVPEREDPRDAIVGADSIESLPDGARIGTSSLRRAAQLRALREDLQIVELRGNVDTRLRKLEAGEADAIVLAAAGLRRLGREAEIGGMLNSLVPAPGQGALIVQGRADDRSWLPLQRLADLPAQMAVVAERAFARALGASCHTPVGAHAVPRDEPDSDAEVRLRAWIGLPDGSEWISDELAGGFDQVGGELAARMASVGARELLARAEGMASA